MLSVVALGLCVVGALLITEVIRPFHDLSRDGPLALGLWITGSLLGITTFFLRGRSIILSSIACALNVIPLVCAFVLWLLLRNSNFLWH